MSGKCLVKCLVKCLKSVAVSTKCCWCALLDTIRKIIGSAEPNELQVIVKYWWGHWTSELSLFSDSPEDPEMPGLEELLAPGPGRIEVVGACSLIFPSFSMSDDLLPGDVLLQ